MVEQVIMSKAYELSDIFVAYNQKTILDIPKLTLPAGKSIAILGDNGAGKSTLLNLLAFLEKPHRGKLTFWSNTIDSKLSQTQRKKIGFVGQHPYLLTGTVADNIRLALKFHRIEQARHEQLIKHALDCVNLSQIVDQPVQTLSGGEIKRVAIARAMAYQPNTLLLDEPFSNLDQRQIQQLENSIHRFASQQDHTVIFSTHDRLQAEAIADMTINLVNGHLTSAPLLNLFHGQLNQQLFNTCKITIHVTSTLKQARHIAIDPREIIVSTQLLKSSMRNSFEGRLVIIAEEANVIRLTIDCGERFHALISPESLFKLNIRLGDTVWIGFKSTAVTVF